MADNHHLLIDRKSYFKSFKQIDSDAMEYDDDLAIQFIFKLARAPYFKMPHSGSGLNDGEFILCEPDGTRFNQRCRDLLDEYGVIYDANVL